MPSSDSNRTGAAVVPSTAPGRCLSCGTVLTGGGCPACAGNGLYRFVHREILLLLALGAIAGTLFLLTRAAAAANRGMRVREAAVWFDLGQRQLQARRLEEAVTSLRRATAIDRDNGGYRLRLAEALAASGHDGAARQVLLELRGSHGRRHDGFVAVHAARVVCDAYYLVPTAGMLATARSSKWAAGARQTATATAARNRRCD